MANRRLDRFQRYTPLNVERLESRLVLSCASAPTGLVGCWSGDGTAEDSIGGNHGVLIDNASYSEGVLGEAFSLGGAYDAVQINEVANQLDGFSQFSIAAWVHPDAFIPDPFPGGAAGNAIATKYDSTKGFPGGTSWAFDVGSTRRLGFGLFGETGRASVVSPDGLIDAGRWTHVAAVWRGGTDLALYVDGVGVPGTLDNDGSPGLMRNNNTPMGIGRFHSFTGSYIGPGAFFEGRIDQVEIYERALTPSEMTSRYEEGRPTYYEGEVIKLPSVAFGSPWDVSGTSFTIDWGDGTDIDTGVPYQGTVTGNHTYADDGIYDVTVTICDDAGESETRQRQFEIVNVSPTLISTLPPAGIVGRWSGDGNAFDTADGNDGTLVQGATFADGISNEAFSLDGIDDAVRIPETTSQLDGFSEFAVAAWINPSQLTPNGLNAIVSKYNTRLGGVSYQFTVDNTLSRDGTLRLGIRVGDGWWVLRTDDAVVATDRWTHVAGIWSGNDQLEIYVDGERVPSTLLYTATPGLPMLDNDIAVNIGRYESSAGTVVEPFGHFSGLIDEVEIYSRALSEFEVQSVYDAYFSSDNWEVDEGTELTIEDLGVFSDPGFDNPLNPHEPPDGSEETFTYSINWGDGEVDSGPATVDHMGSAGGLSSVKIADRTFSTSAGEVSFHTYSTFVDLSRTKWIAWNEYPDVRTTHPNAPGQLLLGRPSIGINDFIRLTVINPDGESLTLDIDQNYSNADSYGPQAVIYGTSADAPDVLRYSEITSRTFIFDEAGSHNAIFTKSGIYEFQFSIQNIWATGGQYGTWLLLDIPPLETRGFFDGSHVYEDDGTFTGTMTVTDDDGGSDSATFTVTVNNVAPDVDAGEDQAVAEGALAEFNGSFNDPGILDTHTIEWDFGDGNTASGSLTPSHVYGDDDVFTVTLTVTDDDGGVGSDTLTVTVGNEAPTIGPVTAPFDPMSVNSELMFSVSATDPGSDDLTFSWTWGDGSPDTEHVYYNNGTNPDPYPSPDVNPIDVKDEVTHTYSTPGVYEVSVFVTDDDGGVNQAIYQYVVVYDPNDGFVTGGGWIYSEAGAYLLDPTLEGRASFGFVSKYAKKDSSPTGQTAFHFNVADLRFHSETYQWLVIASNNAKFKGEGTINGEGGYGFMITATDGHYKDADLPDAFRIKIWDKEDNDVVVYDNKLGLPDNDSAGTQLGGGKVVIHDDGSKLLADAAYPPQQIGTTLTQQVLERELPSAVDYWAERGLPASDLVALQQLDLYVADLSGSQLGLASSSNIIWIDRDAGGFGWDMDPRKNSGMNLIHTIAHELGHKLDYEHSNQTFDVMAAKLHLGDDENLILPLSAENSYTAFEVQPLRIDEQYECDLTDRTMAEFDFWIGEEYDRPVFEAIGNRELTKDGLRLGGAKLLNGSVDVETELIEDELLDLLVENRK